MTDPEAPAMTNGRRDKRGWTPGEFVHAYLTERRHWEIEAAVLDTLSYASENPSELEDSLWAGYHRLLARFVSPKLVNQGLVVNFTNPTDVNPARTVIMRIWMRADLAVVTTREGTGEPATVECEYRVRMVDGEWRLEDRRTMGVDGRWSRFNI